MIYRMYNILIISEYLQHTFPSERQCSIPTADDAYIRHPQLRLTWNNIAMQTILYQFWQVL